ncbi:DUF2793 domain-containing protein [Novosphingobium aquimarinum]|uniref:DUF2793 domain-containing protein n=1 Tax=Novosphingobium aquimarinum TaxID=2682494 RepID=UPI0018DD8A36
MHGAIEAEIDGPPADPQDGECWLIAPSAIDQWAGRDAQLACRQAGQWIYIAPREGMRIFDRSRGQELFYSQGWVSVEPVQEPFGGSTVDPQARAAIADLISALTDLGLLPAA